ncbi:MAG: hypothetical protein ILNGONEN_01016 [Syntrophorhabdaceae bacterium]|nr:hypothetical protein [Syntrophorhabdaceae bacterium]
MSVGVEHITPFPYLGFQFFVFAIEFIKLFVVNLLSSDLYCKSLFGYNGFVLLNLFSDSFKLNSYLVFLFFCKGIDTHFVHLCIDSSLEFFPFFCLFDSFPSGRFRSKPLFHIIKFGKFNLFGMVLGFPDFEFIWS